jgi:hypothetical protein
LIASWVGVQIVGQDGRKLIMLGLAQNIFQFKTVKLLKSHGKLNINKNASLQLFDVFSNYGTALNAAILN